MNNHPVECVQRDRKKLKNIQIVLAKDSLKVYKNLEISKSIQGHIRVPCVLTEC